MKIVNFLATCHFVHTFDFRLKMIPSSWQSLTDHKATFTQQMKELFQADPERFNKFHLVFGDILVDYSKNLVTAETLGLLFKFLEQETQFNALRKGLFSGEKINFTEGRPVLHVYVNPQCWASFRSHLQCAEKSREHANPRQW